MMHYHHPHLTGKEWWRQGQLGGKERPEEAFEVRHPRHRGNVRRRGPHAKVNIIDYTKIPFILGKIFCL